jgi:hypothetical protein
MDNLYHKSFKFGYSIKQTFLDRSDIYLHGSLEVREWDEIIGDAKRKGLIETWKIYFD